MAELWDLLDKDRKPTGKLHERGKPLEKGYYHLVVQIWVYNEKGEFLMSKRHLDKPFGGLWESTGGSAVAGENSLIGAVREVGEELGLNIKESDGKLIKSYRRDKFNDFYDVWLFYSNADITELKLQPEEVIDAAWMTEQEIEQLFNNGELVPTLDYYKEVFEARHMI